tara:strand:+ start:148 stop:843 length:696 start_codon:yes stop_codon:yes gene_type:complete
MAVENVTIKTEAAFCIPIGSAEIPQEICDDLKQYEGMTQDLGKIDQNKINFKLLDKNLPLKQALTDIFATWVNSLLGYPHKWMMTTSWITENSTGTEMTLHNHRNCLYSAVLYFDKCAEDHASLHFVSPIQDQLSKEWCVDSKEDNPFTSTCYKAPYKERQMLFFPSYVKHFHPFFKSSVTRKSFACNFFPVGNFSSLADSSFNTEWFNQVVAKGNKSTPRKRGNVKGGFG